MEILVGEVSLLSSDKYLEMNSIVITENQL